MRSVFILCLKAQLLIKWGNMDIGVQRRGNPELTKFWVQDPFWS